MTAAQAKPGHPAELAKRARNHVVRNKPRSLVATLLGMTLDSIPEADPRRARRENRIVRRIHALRLPQGILNRNGHNVRRLKRDHMSPLLVGDRAHRCAPKASRKQAIVARWNAAALKMTKD